MSDTFWCTCGAGTFRGESFTGRRAARRCARCSYVVGHCKCVPEAKIREQVIHAITVSPGWNLEDATTLVDSLIAAVRDGVPE